MSKPMPFTVTIAEGRQRTTPQNKPQRKCVSEIAEQFGDRTPEEVRGDCKLRLGVPILREENEAFRVAYDTHVKPLPYEQKLAFMMESLDFPVTRLMTTVQSKRCRECKAVVSGSDTYAARERRNRRAPLLPILPRPCSRSAGRW